MDSAYGIGDAGKPLQLCNVPVDSCIKMFGLDLHRGVPVYRQIIDCVYSARASGELEAGNRLPTIRQLAVDLSINPNTVCRTYRERELVGILESHKCTGTFVAEIKVGPTPEERERKLNQVVAEFVARAGRSILSAWSCS